MSAAPICSSEIYASGDRPRSYEDIKALAVATGRKIPDLLALAPNNDPFYVMPAKAEHGRWFAALWERFNFTRGVHLRRIHYKLVSQADPVLMADGLPYENTDRCWSYLCKASGAARDLLLIDPTAIEDKRNPSPRLYRSYSLFTEEPSVSVGPLDEWYLPTIRTELGLFLDWDIPEPAINGYAYQDNDQPFHLELITEKSTMDDILIPLCRTLGINYDPYIGFASKTGAINLLCRIAESKRPGVVFYISDFDPAGAAMPVSVARQLEYWRERYASQSEIILVPVVLTLEQVQRFKLPPIPIKETDRRQGNFLERYGVEGATELDALEALHPGELRNIITKAAAPYRDTSIASQLADIEDEAQDIIDAEWLRATEWHTARLAELKRETLAITDRYRNRLQALSQAISADLEPIKAELESVRQAIKAAADDFRPNLPLRPESTLTLPEQFNGLFDSRRDYLEQISYYKATATEEAAL